MERKFVGIELVQICIFLTLVVFGLIAKADDLAKDRDECGEQLVGLATCLPYVGGDEKAPTLDCCSGIKGVLQKSKICLCILVKDRNDPNLGLKINATLALGLPLACHAPANISECPSLLHLTPNSPDAKVFEDFTNSTKSSTTAPVAQGKVNATSNGSSADISSDGGKGKKKVELVKAGGLLIAVVFQIISLVSN